MQRLEKHALHCGPTGVHLSRVSFQASPDTSAYRFDFLAQGIQGRLAKEDCGVGECLTRSVAEVSRHDDLWELFLAFPPSEREQDDIWDQWHFQEDEHSFVEWPGPREFHEIEIPGGGFPEW